jgi:DNA excision repair protein ERCC-1
VARIFENVFLDSHSKHSDLKGNTTTKLYKMSYEWGAAPSFETLEARRLSGTHKTETTRHSIPVSIPFPVPNPKSTTAIIAPPSIAPPSLPASSLAAPPPPPLRSTTSASLPQPVQFTSTNSFVSKLGLIQQQQQQPQQPLQPLSIPKSVPETVKLLATGSVSVSSLSKDERQKRTIWANESQTSNPLLPQIRHVIIECRKGLEADFVITKTCCVFFLSLKYHTLKPKMMKEKINAFEKSGLAYPYKLRVLLLWVDKGGGDDKCMADLSVFAIDHGLTLLCAFSLDECARYLETMKVYESKTAVSIMARRETEYLPLAQEALTEIKSVNKTDVQRLIHHFGSIADVITAKEDELLEPIGIGELKANNIFIAFNEPFLGSYHHNRQKKLDILSLGGLKKNDERMEEDVD